uniref:PID domain-containing protein n=1 Tax=Ciona savignyi TaxID=51511 RepID=H2Z2D8_CIOSA
MVLGANKWIHPDATLLTSKVVYNVKFVGMTEAKGPRGIDVVNDALQKLKFSRHIKRTEGAKPPKVELSINIHGVKITDNRTKVDLHDIPLHRVSFCADDKQDKRMFSFIAKSDDGKHYCYGLDSQHEANNITLTIGQSFELAYTSFLKTDKGVATSKQVVDLNKRIHVLEKENSDLKQRISELERTSPAK